MTPSQPRRIPAHPSLIERPLWGGVGFEVWIADAVALWLAYEATGLWTLPVAFTLVLCIGFTLFVRAQLRKDAFAIEALTAGLTTPYRYEAQPRILDRSRKPKPSIPRRPVR